MEINLLKQALKSSAKCKSKDKSFYSRPPMLQDGHLNNFMGGLDSIRPTDYSKGISHV